MATHPNIGKSHGQRSLIVYCPWDCKESHTTQRLHNNNELQKRYDVQSHLYLCPNASTTALCFCNCGKVIKKSVTSVSLLVKLIYQKYIFRMLQKSYGSLKENFRTRRTTVKFVFQEYLFGSREEIILKGGKLEDTIGEFLCLNQKSKSGLKWHCQGSYTEVLSTGLVLSPGWKTGKTQITVYFPGSPDNCRVQLRL